MKKLVEDSAPLSAMGSSEDQKREMSAFVVWFFVFFVFFVGCHLIFNSDLNISVFC